MSGQNLTASQRITIAAEWTEKLRDQEERIKVLMQNVYQPLNIYSVFLGVIIAAVAQVSTSSSSKCEQQVYFIVLSIVPFLLYGIPLMSAALEYVNLKMECDRCILQLESLRNVGGVAVRPDGFREMIYKLGTVAAIFILVFFNVLVAYACHAMLCGNKDVSSDANCVQVCNKICSSN